jgi:CsoR family transcriptional regulator, copper-sensing transcriptional repressor
MTRGIPKDRSTKRRLLHRIKIARGHINKVVEMVESDQYCIEIVHQSLAVQAALREFDNAVLKNHLETCVVDSIKRGKSDEAVGEIMKVLEKK